MIGQVEYSSRISRTTIVSATVVRIACVGRSLVGEIDGFQNNRHKKADLIDSESGGDRSLDFGMTRLKEIKLFHVRSFLSLCCYY